MMERLLRSILKSMNTYRCSLEADRFVAVTNQVNVRIACLVPYLPGRDIQLEKAEALVYFGKE